MKKLLGIALLALTATSAQAAGKAPSFVGAWCQTMSVNNGHGEPRDNFYERKTDCPAEDVVAFDARSFDGLSFENNDGVLHV